MDLRDYMRTLVKRWKLIAGFAALGLLGATAASLLATPVYQANTQLFVAVKADPNDTSSALQGTSFTSQRVKSYAAIVNSPRILQPVISQLNLRMSPSALASEVSASVPLDTNLITVSVTNTDPQSAARIADAVGAAFSSYISEIEQVDSQGNSLVKASVVRPAESPGTPVSPRLKLNLALGLIVGLAIGVGLAVLREHLDTSVKDEDDIEAISNDLGRQLNVIGAIGKDPTAAKMPLIVNADPQSKRAEAFRQLRTNLQFVDVDNPPRSIVVTSSVANEGKSTTAANLAITLAQAGLRVALVEADLRRPKLANYMGVERAVGLTDILVGRATATEVMHPFGTLPLKFLPAGRPAPNPSELLGSRAMLTLLRELENSHDIVLLDAPPLLPVTDAAVMSALAGGALLVVRADSTTREQVEEAAEALYTVDARLLGVVLSIVPGRRKSAYDYHYAYPSTDGRARKVTPQSSNGDSTTYKANGRRRGAKGAASTSSRSGRGSRS